MPLQWTQDHRCSLCLQKLRSKSTPIPLDPREEGEVRRLGPKAASQAQAALAKMNAERALAGEPELRLDDPAVFAGRLHYQSGKQCYTVVFKELEALAPSASAPSASAPSASAPSASAPAPAPSAGAGLADQRASQPRRAPKQTERDTVGRYRRGSRPPLPVRSREPMCERESTVSNTSWPVWNVTFPQSFFSPRHSQLDGTGATATHLRVESARKREGCESEVNKIRGGSRAFSLRLYSAAHPTHAHTCA
jgi:hypothetical protein